MPVANKKAQKRLNGITRMAFREWDKDEESDEKKKKEKKEGGSYRDSFLYKAVMAYCVLSLLGVPIKPTDVMKIFGGSGGGEEEEATGNRFAAGPGAGGIVGGVDTGLQVPPGADADGPTGAIPPHYTNSNNKPKKQGVGTFAKMLMGLLGVDTDAPGGGGGSGGGGSGKGSTSGPPAQNGGGGGGRVADDEFDELEEL